MVPMLSRWCGGPVASFEARTMAPKCYHDPLLVSLSSFYSQCQNHIISGSLKRTTPVDKTHLDCIGKKAAGGPIWSRGTGGRKNTLPVFSIQRICFNTHWRLPPTCPISIIGHWQSARRLESSYQLNWPLAPPSNHKWWFGEAKERSSQKKGLQVVHANTLSQAGFSSAII